MAHFEIVNPDMVDELPSGGRQEIIEILSKKFPNIKFNLTKVVYDAYNFSPKVGLIMNGKSTFQIHLQDLMDNKESTFNELEEKINKLMTEGGI